MATLPDFNSDGLLPPGTYDLTLEELGSSHLVVGLGQPGWDSEWRAKLVTRLRVVVNIVWEAGPKEVFIDGSFVEDKLHPNDIDGYFKCDLMDYVSGNLEGRLNAIDPYKCWTWSLMEMRPAPDSTKRQLPMWHRYRVELYPEYGGVPIEGKIVSFDSAFRTQRETYLQKGIIRIVRSSR